MCMGCGADMYPCSSGVRVGANARARTAVQQHSSTSTAELLQQRSCSAPQPHLLGRLCRRGRPVRLHLSPVLARDGAPWLLPAQPLPAAPPAPAPPPLPPHLPAAASVPGAAAPPLPPPLPPPLVAAAPAAPAHPIPIPLSIPLLTPLSDRAALLLSPPWLLRIFPPVRGIPPLRRRPCCRCAACCRACCACCARWHKGDLGLGLVQVCQLGVRPMEPLEGIGVAPGGEGGSRHARVREKQGQRGWV